MKYIPFLLLVSGFLHLAPAGYAQVCDELLSQACQEDASNGWSKVATCPGGTMVIKYCHPKFYIGSGHSLTVYGSRVGDIVFDELLDKSRLKSGLKARKAIGKDSAGNSYTGIFTYDADDHMEGFYYREGIDRSPEIVIPQ